jgi:PAS domain S-box-containing protein
VTGKAGDSGVTTGERRVRATPRRRDLLVPGLVFLALVCVVVIAGCAVFRRQADDMRAESAAALLAVQRAQSGQLSRWFAEQVHDARLLGSAQGITGALERHMKSADGALPGPVRGQLELFRRGHGVAEIRLLDTTLQTVARAPVRAYGSGPAEPTSQERAVAAEALRRDGVAFSGLYRLPGGEVVMDFATPLRDLTPSPDRVIGVAVLRIAAAASVYPLLSSWPPSERTGESVLVARRGDHVELVGPLSVGGAGPLERTLPLSRAQAPAVKAVLGSRGIVAGVDYRDRPVVAAVGRVAGTPWYLVAKQDLAVVDRPVTERGWATLAWVVGLIVLAGVLLLLFLRWRDARALRRLVEAERERRRAEDRYAALMREAKEIVLLIDDRGLIVDANDFALEAYGYSREELIGLDIDGVRATIGDSTPEERQRGIEEAGGRVTAPGVHRRRDGVEFPVEVGVSTVVLEGDQYHLEIVRDVGERRAVEAALRESEARYRTLFESALSGFALADVVAGDDGSPADFAMVAANAAFETQTGVPVEGIVGRRATDAIPGIGSDVLGVAAEVARSGEPRRFETYYREAERHLDIQLARPRPGQLAVMVLDVTERRQAERVLSGFFAGSPVGLLILDAELRFLRVNERLAAMSRVPAEDHLGRPFADVAPRLAESIGPALRRVLDSGVALHGLEVGGPSHDDPDVWDWALVSLFPITDPEGGVRSVGGVVVDVSETKWAERELAESRDFLEHVLGVTPDVIYVFDIAEQRDEFSNRRMVDLLGYAPEEIREMGADTLPRILHPDDRAVLAAHHRRAVDLADGEVLEVEYRMLHADGEWRTLHGRDTVFARDDHGLVTQLIGTARDVTAQRAAEARVRQLGERLEATVMASPLATIAVDARRVVRLWSPAAEAIFGWTAGEVVGRPLPIVPEESVTQAEALLRRAAAGEQFAGLDLPGVRKDGRRIDASVSMALMRGSGGEPESVLMILEDVTERRANVVRLSRLSRLYQMLSAVAEVIPEERDPDKLYARVCAGVVDLGGFRDAWIGAKRRNGLVRVIAAAAAPEAGGPETSGMADRVSGIGVALAEGRSQASRDIGGDPKLTAVAEEAASLGVRSVAAVPIFIDGRHDTALVVCSAEPDRFDGEELDLLERLAADVGFAVEAAGREAARRKAENQLEALNRSLERRVAERTDALEAANAELEAFSYSVSHDLRAPLRALDGFSLALLEDYGDRLDGDAEDYLTRIRGASQRMARLIDDLLMLSRVTRREMTREQVDLSALAREIVAELAAADAHRQVHATVAGNMVATGDPDLLGIALRNLLGNAWKFTARTEAAEVEVGVEEKAGEKTYYVRDNGAGFDQQYADKLFVPFQRLHGEREFPGTGIGLATVQRIVRRHGGRVWVEGATGRGATVRFTLGTEEDA